MTNAQVKQFMGEMLALVKNNEEITSNAELHNKYVVNRFIVEITEENYATFRTLEDAEQYLEQFDREDADYVGRIIDAGNISFDNEGQPFFDSSY